MPSSFRCFGYYSHYLSEEGSEEGNFEMMFAGSLFGFNDWEAKQASKRLGLPYYRHCVWLSWREAVVQLERTRGSLAHLDESLGSEEWDRFRVSLAVKQGLIAGVWFLDGEFLVHPEGIGRYLGMELRRVCKRLLV